MSDNIFWVIMMGYFLTGFALVMVLPKLKSDIFLIFRRLRDVRYPSIYQGLVVFLWVFEFWPLWLLWGTGLVFARRLKLLEF